MSTPDPPQPARLSPTSCAFGAGAAARVPPPQLPAVLLRPAGFADGHLDHPGGPGLAGLCAQPFALSARPDLLCRAGAGVLHHRLRRHGGRPGRPPPPADGDAVAGDAAGRDAGGADADRPGAGVGDRLRWRCSRASSTPSTCPRARPSPSTWSAARICATRSRSIRSCSISPASSARPWPASSSPWQARASASRIDAVSYGAVLASLFFIRGALAAAARRPAIRSPKFATASAMPGPRATIRIALLMVAACAAFGAAYISQMPALARDVLHQGATGLGFLIGSVGVGALFGAYGLARVPERHLMLTPIWRRQFRPVADRLFAIRTGWRCRWRCWCRPAPAWCCSAARPTPSSRPSPHDHVRGRVVSLYTMSFMGMMPWGALMLGWLADPYRRRRGRDAGRRALPDRSGERATTPAAASFELVRAGPAPER